MYEFLLLCQMRNKLKMFSKNSKHRLWGIKEARCLFRPGRGILYQFPGGKILSRMMKIENSAGLDFSQS